MLNQELMPNDVSEFIVLVVLEQILSIVVMKLENVDEQFLAEQRRHPSEEQFECLKQRKRALTTPLICLFL